MVNRIAAILFCFSVTPTLNAQISPEPGARLNFTEVMFEYPKVPGAALYRVQLTEDSAGASFEHCLADQKDSATATLIGNLQFGKKYQWRYAGIQSKREPVWIGPYHFEIEEDSMMKKDFLTVTITDNDSAEHSGGLIINDATRTVITRDGRPVWYLPKIQWQFIRDKKAKPDKADHNKLKHEMDIKPYISDLRLTPYGTISYLTDSAIWECDLRGNVLFYKRDCNPVSEKGEEGYNHVFKRLPDGHYITLGNVLWRDMTPYCDMNLQKKYPIRKYFNGKEYAKTEFGSAIEYDQTGKPVWYWSSENYLDSDAAKPIKTDARFYYELKGHVNSLNMDSDRKYVYMGFRELNRLIKIERSTGKVVDSWGARTTGGTSAKNIINIHRQHDICLLRDGNIATFNNNDYPRGDSMPYVVIFSQDTATDGKILWRYRYYLDSLARRKGRSGGNIDEMKNGNLFVCTGTNNSIFELTRDNKKIVWQAKIKSNPKKDYLYYYRLYRAHYVSSLYPCYFACVTDRDTVRRKSPGFNIHVFNKGSENDSYDITVSLPDGKEIAAFTTPTLDAGLSATFPSNPSPKLLKGRKVIIQVRVSSKTNPALKREMQVLVRR